MRPETQLAIMAALTGFVLKTCLGFCICWAISKVIASPRRRFLVWSGFLICAVGYWVWLATGLAPDTSVLVPIQVPANLAITQPVGKWQLQTSWEFPLSIVLRSLAVLYLIGLAYFLFARIKKQLHLRWILRFTYQPPAATERIFRPIAESLRSRDVQLLMLSGIHSPATFGWISPTILLPPICLEQDERELEDIFRHELQHVRRRDFVFNTIGSLCRALLFFHPAVWYAMRKLELESELACDLAVVSDSPERRATYAECLVRFARLNVAQEPTPWNLDFAGSSVQLKVRVRSILAGAVKIPGWLLGLRVSLGLLAFAGFLCIVPSLFIVLSYEQPRIGQPQKSVSLTTRVGAPLRSRRIHTVRLPGQGLRTGQISASSSPAEPTATPVEAAAEVVPSGPRSSEPTLASEPEPALKQRGDREPSAASTPVRATVVLFSNPTSSSHSGSALVTKGRSVASALLTGATEAMRVASHGRVRDDH